MTDTWTADELRRWTMERWCERHCAPVTDCRNLIDERCTNSPGLFTRCPDCKPERLNYRGLAWFLASSWASFGGSTIVPNDAAALILVATVDSGRAAVMRYYEAPGIRGGWASWDNEPKWREAAEALQLAAWETDLRKAIAQRQRLAGLENKK